MGKSKRQSKENPGQAMATVTVTMPDPMPKGLEFHNDSKTGGVWIIKSKAGLDSFFALIEAEAKP